MKRIRVYKIQLGKTKENIYILDIHMNDRIGSHRYYCLSENGGIFRINRIKSIIPLLEEIEKNGIRFNELAPKHMNELLLKIAELTNDPRRTRESLRMSYFSDLVDYDLDILKKVKEENKNRGL